MVIFFPAVSGVFSNSSNTVKCYQMSAREGWVFAVAAAVPLCQISTAWTALEVHAWFTCYTSVLRSTNLIGNRQGQDQWLSYLGWSWLQICSLLVASGSEECCARSSEVSRVTWNGTWNSWNRRIGIQSTEAGASNEVHCNGCDSFALRGGEDSCVTAFCGLPRDWKLLILSFNGNSALKINSQDFIRWGEWVGETKYLLTIFYIILHIFQVVKYLLF